MQWNSYQNYTLGLRVYILALFIQQAQRMRRIILSSAALLPAAYFPTLSHKRYDFR